MWRTLTIVLAWLTFTGFWMAAIFIYKPPGAKRHKKKWFIFLISAAFVGVIAEYLAADYLLRRFEFPDTVGSVTGILGVALLLSGLCIAIWARITLGRFWSGSVAFIEGQPVVKDGPYSIVRHPIYSGVIMMLWGSLLLEPLGFVLLIAVFGTILLACKARLEERLLEKHLGDKYSNYKKEVECPFIPG